MSVYVAAVEGASERAAVTWLNAHEVPAFTPIARRFRRLGSRKVVYDSPVFPRYVFVNADGSDEGFAAVTACRHVKGLLGRDAIAQPLSAEDDDRLGWWLICQAYGLLDFTRGRKPALTLGQLVRVIGGQFAALNYAGVISEIRGGRVVVIPKTGGRLNLSADQVDAAA